MEIAISNGQTGDTKVLTPASSPLTTSENDDSNPMLPVRATVAQIRVRCTHADIIPIENNLQWSVTIKRNNTLMWAGYLRAELPDMDFSPIPDEITYTADDMLGIMTYRQASTGSTRQTFAQLMSQQYGLIDNSMPVTAKGASATATLSALLAEAYNWKQEVKDRYGNTVVDDDMQDVVEADILNFLGMTARYYRGRVYLGSLFASRYYDNGTLVIPELIDGSRFRWMGFHTITWEQGMGMLTLTAAGRKIESKELPGLGDENFEVEYLGWAAPQMSHATSPGAYNCFMRVLQPVMGWQMERSPGKVWDSLGGYVVDYDIWTTDSQEEKTNFSFTRRLFFSGSRLHMDGTRDVMPTFRIADRTSESDVKTRVDADFYAWLDTQTPYIVCLSDGAIFTNGGGFTLKVTPKVVNSTLAGQTSARMRRVTGFEDLGSRVFGGVYRLQYGGHFWNGTDWQTKPCYFIDGENEIKKKTLSMRFEGDGMAMPVDGVQSGIVKLSFYGAYAYNHGVNEDQAYTEYWAEWYPTNYNASPGYNWYMFENFELVYHPPLDLLAVNKEEERSLSYRTEKFPDTSSDSIDLHLCSEGNISNNWGWVYLSNGSILQTLHWPKARADMMPEQMVLRRHALALGRMNRMATVTIDCEIADLPFQRIALDGRTWYPLCMKTNWQECASELTLLDITDIMAQLPAIGDDEEETGYTRVLDISSSNARTTFRLSAPIDEALTIVWACYGMSGTSVIAAGGTSITVNTGGDIQEERDFDTLEISTPSGKYTIMLTFNGEVNP